jgi:uncharacterized protein (TIGR02231 family)
MYKKIFFSFLLSFILACPAGAEITRVEIYPDQARVQETLALGGGEKLISAELSAHVRQNTLRVHAQQADIASLSSRMRTSAPAKRIESLKNKLIELKKKRDGLKSQINSLQGEISYFRQAKPAPENSVNSVLSMASAVKNELQKSYAVLFEQQRKTEEVEKKIQDIEKDLQQATGDRDKKLVVDILLKKPAVSESEIYLSYVVDNCGWKSEYRLNADPGNKQVDFTWKARVWQNTGVDWERAEMLLSTSRPVWRLHPPETGTWNITPVKENKVLREGRSKMSADKAVLALAPSSEPDMPREQREFRTVYKLGELSLQTGKSSVAEVRRESWPAKFDYLIRPYKAQTAFVRAQIKYEQGVRIPSGKASFFLDSAYVGQGTLEVRGREKDLFFGPDKQMHVDMVNLDRMSGESGFFASKKSYSWKWRVKITNNKTKPVQVVLQDVLPKLGNEDIELEKTFDPQPDKKKDRLLVWSMDIAPGAEKQVIYGYDLTYPEDMRLDLGR